MRSMICPKYSLLSLRASLLIFCGVISSCMSTTGRVAQNTASTMSACDALIQGHANGFEKLRGTRTKTPYGDIWKANYDVVGSGCEIWQPGQGGTHYVCTRAAPDKSTADGYYNAARDTLRNCLGATWQEKEQPRKLAEGVKSVFSKPDETAVVAIHEIQIDGLLRKQWSIYYIVGEQSDSF